MGIWVSTASSVATGIASLAEWRSVSVTFLMMLAAFPLAFLTVLLISFRHDVADWIGAVLGSEQVRRARTVASLPIDDRKMAQRRFVIADAFRMVDDVEKKCKRLKAQGYKASIQTLVREHYTFYRIEAELSEETQKMIFVPQDRYNILALILAGEESFDDVLLRYIRRDIAQLEQKWDLI